MSALNWPWAVRMVLWCSTSSTIRPHLFLRSDSCSCCCCSEDGTRTDYYTWFKNTTPERIILVPRSIRKFDLIWFANLEWKIAMSTFNENYLNEPYLAAHYLSARLFWLGRSLQHHLQHIILKGGERNLPCVSGAGAVQRQCWIENFVWAVSFRISEGLFSHWHFHLFEYEVSRWTSSSQWVLKKWSWPISKDYPWSIPMSSTLHFVSMCWLG